MPLLARVLLSKVREAGALDHDEGRELRRVVGAAHRDVAAGPGRSRFSAPSRSKYCVGVQKNSERPAHFTAEEERGIHRRYLVALR